jgi:hypothetical protein
LPSTKREPSQGQKTTPKGKGKEPTMPPGTAQLDYVDNSLYDRVLRDGLKAAYEGFRVRTPQLLGASRLDVIQ